MKIIIVLIVSLFYSILVFAHPPTKIDISVNETVIGIIVTHPVPNPANHYINKIEVSLNEKKIIEQSFSLQTENTQKASYNIPELKKGDVVTVEADCNQYGELEQKITVP